MANYPTHKMNKDGTLLGTSTSFYSDEAADRLCSLHLSDQIEKDAEGNYHKYYRLHAHDPHTIEMALQYEIRCPECSNGMLKQVGRCLNSHELGLYVCPVCDKRRKHR